MSRLPVVSADGNAWGTILNDFLSQAHNADGSIKHLFTNPLDAVYGAIGNGTTDDTTALAAAIAACSAAGGGAVLLAAMFGITASLTVPTNVLLQGLGPGTGLKALSGFSGSQMVLCNGNYAALNNLALIGGSSSTYSSNPATNAVQVTGALWVTLRDISIFYTNGWAVQYQSTSGSGVFSGLCDNVYAVATKNGIHLQGHSAQAYAVGIEITNCYVDHTESGECYFLEDSGDVMLSQCEGNESGASAAALHIKGNSGVVYISTCDFGNFAGANGPNVLIESGANGSPSSITITSSTIQFGTPGLSITNGQSIRIVDCDIIWNLTHGINVSGGDAITFDTCTFNNNGATAGAGHYDLQTSTGGNIRVTNCTFLTPQGTTANHVASAINDTAFALEVYHNNFAGTGMNASNIFAGFPKYIRNCKGYNPIGNVGVSVPASTVNFATNSVDATYFVTGGTVTSIKIGGIATGLLSGAFRVPAQQTFSITYSVVPSVTCFLD